MEQREFPLDNVTFEGPLIVRVWSDRVSALDTDEADEAFWLAVSRFATALSVAIERETLAMDSNRIFVNLDITESKAKVGAGRNRHLAHEFYFKVSDCTSVISGIIHALETFLSKLDKMKIQAVCDLTVIF